MPGVKDDAKGFQIKYNGFAFGGDAGHESFPPIYRLAHTFEYDDARRKVKEILYTLTVKTVVFADDETTLTTRLQYMRNKLEQPGKKLFINGVGLGFPANAFGQSQHVVDVSWGPLPQALEIDQVCGDIVAQVTWVCQFRHKPCFEPTAAGVAQFKAFNFSCNWRSDAAGLMTRTVRIAVEVPQLSLDVADGGGRLPLAAEVREQVFVKTPPGFRRLSNDSAENEAKNRVEIVAVDEQLPGDNPPQNLVKWSGRTSIQASGQGGAFPTSFVTMAIDAETRPGVPPAVAGVEIFKAFVKKQAELQAGIAQGAGGKNGFVVPTNMVWTAGQGDARRFTSASITWTCTGCFESVFNAANIWKRIDNTSWSKWATSMTNGKVWDTLGVSGLQENLADDIIIDLCDDQRTHTISGDAANPDAEAGVSYLLECPEIPEENSYLAYDLRLQVVQKNYLVEHRTASEVQLNVASPGNDGQGSGSLSQDGSFPVPGSGSPLPFNLTNINGQVDGTPTTATNVTVEQTGQPQHLVMVQFKCLQLRWIPVAPKIKTIAGNPAYLVGAKINAPYRRTYFLRCPVYFMSGALLYRVVGNVDKIQSFIPPNVCGSGGKILSDY